MGAKSRVLLLVLVMTSVAMAVGGIALFVLYRAAFEQERVRLTELAKSQSQLVEAVARFNAKYSRKGFPGGAFAATLMQISDAHARLEGFAQTAEFTLAKREGDQIVFLLTRRHDKPDEPEPVPFSSELAEPMRRALSEKLGGTVVGLDYRGETVLAAYEPVAVLDLGIVAKIDLAEIRRPFVKAGLLAGASALVLIWFGTVLVLRIGNPIVQQLQESEERLNLALKSAEVGTWDWNILKNSATWDDYIHALFGLKPGVFSGGVEGLIDVFHPDDRQRVRSEVARSVEENAEYDTEYRVVWPDGSQHDLATRGKVYRDKAGRAVRMAGVVWDVTDRKRMEEAALNAQLRLDDQQRLEKDRVEAELEKVRNELVRKTRLATVGQISASIAHDLRNPLGAARNAIYYLRHSPTRDESKTAEYLEIIDEEIGSADRIIGKLLEMARAEKPAKQAVDLGRVVKEVFDATKETRQMRCRTTIRPDPFVVRADPDLLRQVVGNILSNAVNATEGRGEFLVEATRQADCDTIVFRDTGPGIAPEFRQNVFEPLVTGGVHGTGLGLAICREIVQRHGGTIEAIDYEQRGAAFQIRLPRG